MSNVEDARLAGAFAQMASQAGGVILELRERGVEARRKSDKSPVTDADERAEAILIDGVSALFPGVDIVAEEQVAKHGPPTVDGDFLLIDALDGTSAFVRGGDDFTVNVGLIENGQPVLGFVYAPVDGRFFFGGRDRALVCRLEAGAAPDMSKAEPLSTRAYPVHGLTAVCSHSNLDSETSAFIDKLDVADRRSRGSSIKFCSMALGEADVYPRFGPTSEWDIAAGHAVLNAAGGCLLNPDATPFSYAKPGFRNGAFVAWGREPVL